MSLVESYRCDHCGEIKEVDEIVGILPITDIFNVLDNNPVTTDPKKATAHHCTECLSHFVANKAEELSPRQKDERTYQLRFRELYALFRQKCVENFRSKKKTYKRLHG